MDIFGILTAIGGLALFLYGMNVMGESLSKLSGGKMENILERLTSTRLKAVLLGALVTAVIQSSSATTVMVVGFVNSGIMQLGQAVGIIMGANVGTTITSWLLSLVGISGSNVFVNLLKPSSFSPILAAIGIVLTMTAKHNDKKRDIGTIFLGFAILMFGMETMSGAVSPLAYNDKFTGILTMFSNPILGMMAGALLTAVIQSSSASVGILQALCLTGAVGYSTAIPIIMGQNIGTCVTAIISSVGANKNARRASMIHLYFNLIGTAIFMIVFYGVNSFAHFAFLDASASAVGIAVIHSLFNIGCTIVLFPFANGLVRLATITVKDKQDEIGEAAHEKELPTELTSLDERFLGKPAFAMELCRTAAASMARETRECIFLALQILHEYNEDVASEIVRKEQLIDSYEDILGTYLVKLSGRNLSQPDSQTLSVLLHCTSDLERISDHAVNILDSAKEMKEKNQAFSKKAMKELDILMSAIHEIVEMTVDIFANKDIEGARMVEPLEDAIDGLNIALRQNHIRRLRNGKCTIELGIALEDIITDLERVSDHCSNIAVCMIQVSEDVFGTHEYIDTNVKQTKWFADEVAKWQEKYRILVKKEGK
ncbi:MAG: Na/Pi cotransporter family protein [Wujia sp.]